VRSPRRFFSLLVACAVGAAAPKASAQWNEEKQAELERERIKASADEFMRRASDPEEPVAIATKTLAVKLDSLGLRGGAVDSRSGGTETGFALALAASDYFDGAVNRRVSLEARVGESSGVEGSVRADAAVGYRFDLDPWYGFFVRGGVRGRLYGTERLSLSSLEVPQAQVGFQVWPTKETKADSPLGPISLLEVAGRASAGLVARAEVDTYSRHLKPTPTLGGHLALTVKMFAMNVEYARFLPNGASTSPIDDAGASLCAFGKLLAMCANGEATWSAVLGPANDERRERILMVGGTMSVALRELLPRGSW
jgi:hypothetical protein